MVGFRARLTHPTNLATFDLAPRRCFGLLRAPVLVEEKGFFDAVVDEIPWQCFGGVAFAIHVKIGVDGNLFQGLSPIAMIDVGLQQNLGNSSIAAGQECLDVGPAGDVGVDLQVGYITQGIFDCFYFSLEGTDIIHCRPLKRREGLGDKGIEADGDGADATADATGLQKAMFDLFDQAYDRLNI